MKPYTYSHDYFTEDESLPTQIDDKSAQDVFFKKISFWGDFVENVKNGYYDIQDPDSGLWDFWLKNGEHIFTGHFNNYDDLKPYTGQQWKKNVVAFIWFNTDETWWWFDGKDSTFEMFSNDLDWFNE